MLFMRTFHYELTLQSFINYKLSEIKFLFFLLFFFQTNNLTTSTPYGYSYKEKMYERQIARH